MSKRGPTPARSEERRRRNEPVGPHTKAEESALERSGVNTRPEPPEPNENWEPRTQEIYAALCTSPGIVFMYDADWATAMSLLDQYDMQLKPQFVGFEDVWNSEAAAMEHRPVRVRQPMNGATLNALYTNLMRIAMIGEDVRRRMQFEAPMLDLADYSERTGPTDDGVVRDINEARRRALAEG